MEQGGRLSGGVGGLVITIIWGPCLSMDSTQKEVTLTSSRSLFRVSIFRRGRDNNISHLECPEMREIAVDCGVVLCVS